MQIKIYVVESEFSLLDKILSRFRKNSYSELRQLKQKLIKLFGGLTEDKNPKKGYWINENNKIEFDKVLIWEILTNSEDFNKNIEAFNNLIEELKKLTKQKSQLYTLNPKVKPVFI